MVSCQDIGLLMSLALDQSLDESEARSLEEHLSQCSTCREEW